VEIPLEILGTARASEVKFWLLQFGGSEMKKRYV
jgi:hypothetical protein